MRFALCGAILATTFVGSVTFATATQAAGLTFLHKIEQVGNRMCMVEHDHHGDSRPNASKEAAAFEAARAWSSFTALEYGREWADIRLSIDQHLKCSPVAMHAGQGWQCKIRAKPCSPATANSAAAMKAAPAAAMPSKDVTVAQASAPAPAPVAMKIEMRVTRDRRAPAKHVHTPYCGHRHAEAHQLYHGTARANLVWPGDRR